MVGAQLDAEPSIADFRQKRNNPGNPLKDKILLLKIILEQILGVLPVETIGGSEVMDV